MLVEGDWHAARRLVRGLDELGAVVAEEEARRARGEGPHRVQPALGVRVRVELQRAHQQRHDLVRVRARARVRFRVRVRLS